MNNNQRYDPNKLKSVVLNKPIAGFLGRSFGGSSKAYIPPSQVPRIYVDYDRVISLNTSDPLSESAIAGYKTRLARVSRKMKIATGATTYAEFLTGYNALTAEEKTLPLMTNIEFPYWNTILSAKDSDSVAPEWRSAAATIEEFNRYNTLLGTSHNPASAGMAVFKAVAEKLWQDCHVYAKSQGTPSIVAYNGDGIYKVGYVYGVPLAAVWPGSGPNTTLEYYKENLPSFPSLITEGQKTPDGGAASMLRAITGTDGFGQAAYCFYPTNGLPISNIGDWNDGSLVRSINNVVQSEPPNFLSSAAYTTWMSRHVRSLLSYSQQVRNTAIAADPTLNTPAASKLIPILYLGISSELYTNYIVKNHLYVADTDPIARAQTLYASCFGNNTYLDQGPYTPPDQFYIWDLANYYDEVQLCTSSYSPTSPYTYRMYVLLQRYAWERMCCGLPMTPPGSPIGAYTGSAFNLPTSPAVPDGTNGGTHWNWFWNNTLNEATYYGAGTGNTFPDSTIWHTPGGGSTLPGGRSLALGVLASRLNFTQNITGGHVKRAWLDYATEYRVLQVEELARILPPA